jgi:hypothetical protein
MAAGAANKTHDRADVDDRAATGLCHLLGGELGAKEHAGLVDGDDTMPALYTLWSPTELPEIPALFTKMFNLP